jgi:glycosyltransferase involved in cell wall biosynthesis
VTKIAACLIVRNSADTIENCLNSIRPFVDEINVYDTGSTDDTIRTLHDTNAFDRVVLTPVGEFVKRLFRKDGEYEARDGEVVLPLAPIRVERGEWRDDFSWAREQSFAMASDDVDWLLWADDDDVIEGAQWLRQMAATAASEVDGFIFNYDYARDELGNCVCELWRERLMRRSAGYRWLEPIHEVLAPPDGKTPGLVMVPREQVRYIHDRPADRYDPERNLKILLAKKDAAEAAGEQVDPRTLAYLGTELMAKAQFADAAQYLLAYLSHQGAGWSDERMQVAHKLATCLRHSGNPMAAIEVEANAIKERVDWAETYVGLAESYACIGKWPEVEHYATLALAKGQPQSMLILNPLEFTFVPYVRLSEACLHTGRPDEAGAWIERAAQIAPQHPLLNERIAQVAQARNEAHMLNAALTLREALVRHDENAKALAVIENVPYLIAEHPAIVKARADQRDMCKHLLRPEEYRRWYVEEPKESTLTDEHIDHVGEWFGRVAGLEAGLAEQEAELGRKPVLLDAGCNDWWMGEYFARRGIRCDGVELNRTSYEKALERVERFGRDVMIVHGDLHDAADLLTMESQTVGPPIPGEDALEAFVNCVFPRYDAVSLFEVLEHVPDIEATLDVLESLIRPGGRIYISTPNGAFESGNLPNWAKVERKGHLRALPMHELAEILSRRGNVEQMEFTNGDRVAFCSYTPAVKKGKVILYAGGGWEQWAPDSIDTTGLGGSETALVKVAAGFADEGYEVKVYSGAEPGLFGGALWRPFTAWDPTEECDLLVVSRLPHVFDNPLGARRTALWCHDHSYPGVMTEDRAERMDSVVVLSEWERERFARLYPYLEEKLVVIRNGITLADPETGESRFSDAKRTFAKRKSRCLFTSSADRGLDVMLDVWPEIRESVPDAELHVFYGFDVFDRVALTNPQLIAYKAQLLQQAQALGGEDGGIHLRGRIGQAELYKEMQEARVWSYPTAFLETSCIGAMEARAAGLPIVTSDLGALAETVGTHGQLLPWAYDEDEPHNRSDEYKSWFVREVVRLLTDAKHWQAWHRRALAGADRNDWAERTEQWVALTEVAEPLAIAA